MYLLDTNIVSTFISAQRNSLHLSQRILAEPPEHLFISIITIEEILSGTLAAINRLRHASTVTVTARYQEFNELFTVLHQFQIIPYTEAAEQIYRSMTLTQKRVGTQDCRIAATAMASGLTVVTANTSDFMRIGNVTVEDWTLNLDSSSLG